MADAVEAAKAGADIVMLDNFNAVEVGVAAKQLKASFPHLLIEASGVRNTRPFEKLIGIVNYWIL